MPAVKCDILICGAGLAGLSLLYRALRSGTWTNEQIIVADRSLKTGNDRTWSFWKKEDSAFEELIRHRWKDLVFFTAQGEKIPLQSGGYTYNSIRSIDLYRFIHTYLKGFSNVSFIQEEILEISSAAGRCTLTTSSNIYESLYLFNSVCKKQEELKGGQYFLQHFKGLRIRTATTILPPDEAYLMDFRTGQEQGTTFFYTLPVAENELFIEYTLFSKSLLPAAVYDQKIKSYLHDVLKIDTYEILEEEFGVIPMTDHPFKRFDGNIVHIGTAGGDTRASTGYTFTNIQKTIDQILHVYQSAGNPFFEEENISLKHQLYDAALLNVLAKQSYEGHQLFTDLFSKVPAYRIFAFLDAETSVIQDLQIMKSLKV
ncbi:MAG TPA: lycopene cyclase family protein, partial [Pedobacter sp.]